MLITLLGVVWVNLQLPGNASFPLNINDWPGLPAFSFETKVPTKIAYLPSASEPIWGFLCQSDDAYYETAELREHFKIYLDRDRLRSAQSNGVREIPETVDEASRLVTDYLRQIYKHVKTSIEKTTGNSWSGKRIEFLFSLPTTWDSLETTNRFRDAVQAAGFTAENPAKHTATLELTEAEAAAVYMATTPQVQLSRGDIALVCDAGGGTTE